MRSSKPVLVGVVTLVAVALVGCGPTATASRHPVSLVYRAVSDGRGGQASPAGLRQTAALVRTRLRVAGVPGAAVAVSGDRLTLTVPAGDPPGRASALVEQTGQVDFYDWEADVIGPRGRPAPGDPAVTGGTAAGGPASGVTLYQAVARAAARPSQRRPGHAEYYVVDSATRTVLAGPADIRPTGPRRGRTRVVEVRPGTIVVAAEAPFAGPDSYYVLNDAAAVTGREISNPQQSFDNEPGATRQPGVTFAFTPAGTAAFARLTRQIARRALVDARPGRPSLQHFAIVLDDRLVSVPFVDSQQYPDGIQATDGSQIFGGFTIASARALAAALRTGPLPVKLALVSGPHPF